jgi:hypothetical protein
LSKSCQKNKSETGRRRRRRRRRRTRRRRFVVPRPGTTLSHLVKSAMVQKVKKNKKKPLRKEEEDWYSLDQVPTTLHLVKRSILTTLGATNSSKTPNHPNRGVIRDFRHFFVIFGCFMRFF